MTTSTTTTATTTATSALRVHVQLNGQPQALPAGATLADLLAGEDAAPQALATAVNGEFVARAARAQHVLCDGDQVFTFQPITGG
jgi:sulfur carrier protein